MDEIIIEKWLTFTLVGGEWDISAVGRRRQAGKRQGLQATHQVACGANRRSRGYRLRYRKKRTAMMMTSANITKKSC
jgi:hypothetical protein